MGGGSHPGEFIEFEVLERVGPYAVIKIATPEQAEYVEPGETYVGNITPKPE